MILRIIFKMNFMAPKGDGLLAGGIDEALPRTLRAHDDSQDLREQGHQAQAFWQRTYGRALMSASRCLGIVSGGFNYGRVSTRGGRCCWDNQGGAASLA